VIQVFTCYAVIMSVIGLFVALSQVDFMLIRLAADLIVNHFTTYFFLRGKTVNMRKYEENNRQTLHNNDSGDELEDRIEEALDSCEDVVIAGPLRNSHVPASDTGQL